jgi:hypothetical protein
MNAAGIGRYINAAQVLTCGSAFLQPRFISMSVGAGTLDALFSITNLRNRNTGDAE